MAFVYNVCMGCRHSTYCFCSKLYWFGCSAISVRVNIFSEQSLNMLSIHYPFFRLPICDSAAESGYIPGILFILSKVYTPDEFSIRVGILLTMATLSGLVSGPLAYGVSFLDGRNGLTTWQYLFIVEGVPTIVLSMVSYIYLFNDIQDVKWLSTEQKVLQVNRMVHQCAETNDNPVTMKKFKKAVFDWKTLAFSTVFLLNSINVTSITVFSPSLIGGKVEISVPLFVSLLINLL